MCVCGGGALRSCLQLTWKRRIVAPACGAKHRLLGMYQTHSSERGSSLQRLYVGAELGMLCRRLCANVCCRQACGVAGSSGI